METSTSRILEISKFEKYSALRQGESAKRTWFLRIDFRRTDTTARYLFFFGHASYRIRDRCDVTLHVAREEPPNSYHYEKLEYVSTANVPDLVEIGYESVQGTFRRAHAQTVARVSVASKTSASGFFEEVVAKHFSA